MKKLNHKYVWLALGLLLIDSLLFGTTNAATAPSFAIIVGFVLLVATIYGAVNGLLRVGRLYGLQLPRRRSAIYLSALLGGLLALQSINELSRRDVLIWLPLLVLGYLYSYARTGRRDLEN